MLCGKTLEKSEKNHYNRHNSFYKTIIIKSGKHLCQNVLTNHTNVNVKSNTASVSVIIQYLVAKFLLVVVLKAELVSPSKEL